MLSTNRIRQLLAIVVAALGLAAAATLVGPINDQRVDLQLTLSPEIGDSVPPDIALATTASGAFRGLAIDVLWYRANQLQDEGKYFEANQLANLITTLQPRFPQVWAFQAWNMAYNISVATHTPQERWDWVRKGLRLLQDRGIPLNENAIRLYRELSWIYFHKVGQFSDDMHWYYKRQLAYEWQEILGDMNVGASTEQVLATFKKIVDAPDELDALVEQQPEVVELIERFNAEGWTIGPELLRQYGRYRMFGESVAARVRGIDLSRLPTGTLDPKLIPVFEKVSDAPAFKALLTHLKKRTIREAHHMDPAFMLDLMEQFGPIDWRHPAAHSAYWSALGIVKVGDLRSAERVDAINTDRQTIHSLQALEHFGRISFDPIGGHLDMMPDPRFIPAYEKAVERAYARIDEGVYRSTTENTFDAGHENFLLKAIYDWYLYGDVERAAAYYEKVRRRYGDKAHNQRSGRYLQPLPELVLDYMEENLDMMSNTRQFVQAMLHRGFREGLANGRYDLFQRRADLARRVHEKLQQRARADPLAVQDRMSLLPFDELLERTYSEFLSRSQLDIQLRARIWHNTPDRLRRRVYDQLAPQVYEQAGLAGFDPRRAFPAPEGMEQTRRRVMQELAEKYADREQDPIRVERK